MQAGTAEQRVYAKCRTERFMRCGYSVKKLEIINMPLTQRCNYAGSLGKPVPTRSFLSAVSQRLRGLALPLPRLRR